LLATNGTFQKTTSTSLPSKNTPTKQPSTTPKTQELGLTTRNTQPRVTKTTTTTPTPTPTTTNQPLPPKQSRYREQAAKEQTAYNNAKKLANPSATYLGVEKFLDEQLPLFDNNKLSQEAQDFLATYELVIDAPEQLIFE
jgi:hypothetical protein